MPNVSSVSVLVYDNVPLSLTRSTPILSLSAKPPSTPPAAPTLEKVPSHYHEYLDCCTSGKQPTSSLDWTVKMTDAILLGNLAQLSPEKTLKQEEQA